MRPGSTVIDVRMNSAREGHLVGDVEFEIARGRAAWITPVPGGVGPTTVAMLMHNTLRASQQPPQVQREAHPWLQGQRQAASG